MKYGVVFLIIGEQSMSYDFEEFNFLAIFVTIFTLKHLIMSNMPLYIFFLLVLSPIQFDSHI